MKTQTQVEINLKSIEGLQNFQIEQDGLMIKCFLSCSEIYSRPFKVIDSPFELNQTLKMKNIVGNQLQIWLCNTEDKIIAYSTVNLIKQGQQDIQIQLKLNNIALVKLYCSLSIATRQIQKILYVEPDQELLKRQEDSEVVRLREQQELKKLKEQQELQKLAQQEKKFAITKTHRNTKDQAFL